MFLLRYLYLSLSFWALCVSAFYPFVPPWMCEETGNCSEPGKRSENAIFVEADTPVKGSLTMKLRQRLPSNDQPHGVRVARYFERLTKKYAAQNNAKRANTYRYVASNTPTQAYSAAINQDGTDFSYFAVANFGSSGTPLFMLMDTGASSSWVMSSSCTSDPCLKHNTFGPGNSKTYQAGTGAFSIGYGTGSVSGLYATDIVAFAGFSFPFTFGAATQISRDFLSFPMDGILGLAQSVGAKPPTFLESLANSKALASNSFGININRAADGTNDGEINFGAPDKSKYTGNLGFTSTVVLGGNWAIPVEDAGMGNKFAGFQGKIAIIDSGTSYAFIPAADAKLLFALVPGAVSNQDALSYSVPCATTASIQFKFSGVAYDVSSKDWVGVPSGNPGSNMCMSNIYARDATGTGSWLLGDLFLKNVYALFDVDQNRIGFGVKSGGSAAATPGASTGMGKSSSLLQNTFSSPVVGSDRPSATAGPLLSSFPLSTGTPSTVSSNRSSTVTGSSMTPTASSAVTSSTDSSQGFNAAITSKSTPTSAVTGVAQSATAAATLATTNGGTQLHSPLTILPVGILLYLFAYS